MFNQKIWSLTGTSGTNYHFSIRRKSEGLPHSSGVFILAYTHPGGHMAGWVVNPLYIGHSDDMSSSLAHEVRLNHEQKPLWNCNFVLLESIATDRELCVRDLAIHTSKYI